MRYCRLTKEKGLSLYQKLKTHEEFCVDEFVDPDGSGEEFPYALLQDAIEEVLRETTFPLLEGRAAQFEGRIGVALHKLLSDVSPTQDLDFWRWLSFGPLLKVTLRRQEKKNGEIPKKALFGLQARTKCFAYRSWHRAEIGFDPTRSVLRRYELALRGEQDFWVSHLEGQRYTFSRTLAHALIEFQYPTEDGRPLLKAGENQDGVRELVKRLKRRSANVALAVLTREQCKDLISELAIGCALTDGGIYSRSGEN